MKNLVEVEKTYNKKGVLIKYTIGGIKQDIPPDQPPTIVILDPTAKWVRIKKFYSREQAKEFEQAN